MFDSRNEGFKDEGQSPEMEGMILFRVLAPRRRLRRRPLPRRLLLSAPTAPVGARAASAPTTPVGARRACLFGVFYYYRARR